MNKQDFLEFLEGNVLSLFTGSEVVGEEPSSVRDACVAQGVGGSVLVKFKKSDEYRFIIKRVQPFKKFEIAIIKTIIAEMGKIYVTKIAQEYRRQIEHMIMERAICKAITVNHSTLQTLLTELSSWSQRTYEGARTNFGFVISNKKAKESNDNLSIKNFLRKDFCALLSDGTDTFIEISSNGYLLNYLSNTKINNEDLFVPLEYLKIANLCTGSKIGVCLLPDGDILLFKEKALIFARRSGNWVCFSHQVIIDKLADKVGDGEEIRKALYLSSLDTSFKKCGGCVVHISNNDRYNVLKHINAADVLIEDCYNHIMEENKSKSFFSDLTEEIKYPPYHEFIKKERCAKTANLIKIIKGRKFHELSRKLRQELIGIDGATVIDYDGSIIAVGAIIKIDAGSSGGGRLAAARMLSNYGISIKISNDGSIQGFRTDRSKLRVKPLFVIG